MGRAGDEAAGDLSQRHAGDLLVFPGLAACPLPSPALPGPVACHTQRLRALHHAGLEARGSLCHLPSWTACPSWSPSWPRPALPRAWKAPCGRGSGALGGLRGHLPLCLGHLWRPASGQDACGADAL